ncbi:DNA-binding protein [Actinoplanes sp. NPDC051470]|uniref:DNA-binding protein n=1 Tax=Actinoplanes sp. NPDC051470 TaxID=3157224 RepID=UPI003417497F
MKKWIRLMGMHEVRMLLGDVSKQRAYQITNKTHFPKPAADLAQGRIWRAEEVEAWVAEHRHRLGEPAEQEPLPTEG